MKSHTVDAGGGVTLAAREYGDPGAPALLLVHGFPDRQDMWSLMVGALAERFHVITYDLRGAGASSVPSGERPYALHHLAADARAVLDHIVPGQPVHLVGHDWGGIQGWEFLYAEPTRPVIRSFTCISGACFDHAGLLARDRLGSMSPRLLLQSLDQLRRSWYMLVLQAPGVFRFAWRHLVVPRWPAMLARMEGVPRGGEYPGRGVLEDGLNLSGLYFRTPLERLLRPVRTEPVTIPVQVIRPLGDRFLAAHTLDGIERFAPGVRIETIPGGHWSPRTQPGRLVELITAHAQAADAAPHAAAA